MNMCRAGRRPPCDRLLVFGLEQQQQQQQQQKAVANTFAAECHGIDDAPQAERAHPLYP